MVRYRSAITGRFVKSGIALRYPRTTVRQVMRKAKR